MRRLKGNSTSGFSLIQLMVSSVLVALIVVGALRSFKNSSQTLMTQKALDNGSERVTFVQKLLLQDIQRAADLNAPCGGTTGIACSGYAVQAGVTPLTSATVSTLNYSNAEAFRPTSAFLTAATTPYDALRIVTIDEEANDVSCPLPASSLSGAVNPDPSGLTFTVNLNENAACAQLLANAVGKIFMVQQLTVNGMRSVPVDSQDHYQTVLIQITGATVSGNVLTAEVSGGSLFNTVDPTGAGIPVLQAFSNGRPTRLYPVKFIEWAVDAESQELKRRVFRGAPSGFTFGAWQVISKNLETFHFGIPRTQQISCGFYQNPSNQNSSLSPRTLQGCNAEQAAQFLKMHQVIDATGAIHQCGLSGAQVNFTLRSQEPIPNPEDFVITKLAKASNGSTQNVSIYTNSTEDKFLKFRAGTSALIKMMDARGYLNTCS